MLNKRYKVKKNHLMWFAVMLFLVGVGMYMIANNPARTTPAQQILSGEADDERLSAPMCCDDEEEKSPRWVWNELPDTVTQTNNYYGGAKVWTLSEDLAMHMCWCYGMRVTHFNPETRYDGEEFQGHFVWSREESNDIVFTDRKNYIAVFDYEKRLTSTFAKEGSRSYRFLDWSVYFFSDGTFQVTDREGTVTVMRAGMFQIDPIEEWRFEVTPEYLIHLDQQFMISLLINQSPWEN